MCKEISRRMLLAGAAALTGAVSVGACTIDASANDALGDFDATGVAERVRSGEISAQEALEAAIARTERVNPQLNFIATKLYEYGRERASQPLSGPFAGVPTLIKDLMPIVGQPTKFGSRAFAENISDEQPPYMDALLAAGLAPFGKSTTPEFGLTATTEPMLGGPTRNPWELSHSSGGSSGGAAVAVAARVVPIAHASDGGGSIRIPASCNGLFGLKVSRDRTVIGGRPEGGIPLSVNGCLSRSVRDTATWLAVTEQTGSDAILPPVGVVAGPSTQRLRILLDIIDARGNEPDPQVRAAIEDVAELCRSLGHEVREGRPRIDGSQFAEDFTLLWAAGAAEVVDMVQSEAADTPLDQLLEPLTLDLARHFERHGMAGLEAAVSRLRPVESIFAEAFAEADVMLTPVLSKPPLRIGEISPTLGMEVGFARVTQYVGYTPLQNVAGAPAMSVPLAWSSDGLPIGAHFSAPRGQERRLLELAYELEQARPWAGRKPAVNAS
jgi:amidase